MGGQTCFFIQLITRE